MRIAYVFSKQLIVCLIGLIAVNSFAQNEQPEVKNNETARSQQNINHFPTDNYHR